LFWGLLLLGLPYVCHLGIRYIILQKPHWIPQLLLSTLQQQQPQQFSSYVLLPLIRPPVTMSSERQVLIVGSMSSGTSQVATEFARYFPGFELGHEDSDTLWKFVRDGTISWFHGIRFFPPIDSNVNNYTISSICSVAFSFYTSSSNYGFGPTLFGTPHYQCSPLHPKFQRCWLDECQRILTAEYGCTYTNSCPTPYRRTLLQVRDPWNITTSLVTKYCRASHNVTLSHKPPQTLVRFFLVLLGPMFQTPDEEAHYGAAAPYFNCETLMAMYVITYYTILLDAMDHQGTIRQLQHEELGENIYNPQASRSSSSSSHGQGGGLHHNYYRTQQRLDGIYAIEASTVCDVAQLAGLYDWKDTVYRPHYETVYRVCGGGGGLGDGGSVEEQQRKGGGGEEEFSSSTSDNGDADARSATTTPAVPPKIPRQRPGVFSKTHNTINKGRLTSHELIRSMKEKSTEAVFEMVHIKMRHLYARLKFYEYPIV
jgi:hypothetical protein